MEQVVQAQELKYEDPGHRLIVYGQKGDAISQKAASDHCRSMCTMRTATLKDLE